MGIDEINAIRSNISGKGFSWVAGATSVSGLTREAKVRHLGLVVPEDEKERIRELMDKRACSVSRAG